MKKFFSALLYFFLSVQWIAAQNYRQDMDLVLDQIKAAEVYHITGKVSVYSNQNSGRLIQSFEADVQRNGSGYRSKIDDAEIISNEQMLVTIDHEEKYIQVENQQKLSRQDEALLREIHALNKQDSLILSTDLVSESGTLKTYRLFLKGDISVMEITLDLAQKSIKKMAYFYDEKKFPENNYVVIEYTRFSFENPAGDDLIKGKDIIEKSGAKIIPIGKYKAYHLVNLYQD